MTSLMKKSLYTLLRESGLTYVSVGHRSSLIPFHDLVLELDGAGGWKLTRAEELLKAQ